MNRTLLSILPSLAGRHRYGAALTAQEIRKVLKMAFPGQKFSVKSKTYSGGDSVSVSWVNGPTTKEVNRYTKDFQSGSFNGMEDIYEYTNVNNNIPQTKYLFLERSMSDSLHDFLQTELRKEYQIDNLTEWEYKQFINRQARVLFEEHSFAPNISGIAGTTFKQYLNQTNPKKNLTVNLTPADIYHSWQQYGVTYVQLQISGNLFTYAVNPTNNRLYTLDKDGNPKSPSVFYLSTGTKQR